MVLEAVMGVVIAITKANRATRHFPILLRVYPVCEVAMEVVMTVTAVEARAIMAVMPRNIRRVTTSTQAAQESPMY